MSYPVQPSYEQLAARVGELSALVAQQAVVIAQQSEMVSALEAEVASVRGIEHFVPHRTGRHPVPRPSRTVTCQPGTLPGPGTPALDRHAAHATKTLKPESQGEPAEPCRGIASLWLAGHESGRFC